VLLVDDDPGILLSVRRALEFEGYQVPTAADGVEALEAIERDAPDAVVLDVTMPASTACRCAATCGPRATPPRSWC